VSLTFFRSISRSLTWAYLQEKLTTTPYGPSGEKWHFPVFLNTIQSVFAATVGCVYLLLSTPRGAALPPVIPSHRILGPLALVAVTSSLASPFGYASLAHIDYITFLLAKSCKLLPVMFLHITLFRKRYPLYKYLVVAAVTAGVAVFTLHSGRKHKASSAAKSDDSNVAWGLLLLGINLLFDGLTNSTQDYIFQTFRPYSGPQMMCANNMMSTLVTGLYLLASPYLVSTGLGDWFGMDVAGSAGELGAALDFMRRHPSVWKDVLGFAACGAVGQVFICEHPRPPSSTAARRPKTRALLTATPANDAPSARTHNSLHALHLLLRPARHRHRHPQDVHHDPLRRRLRPPPHPHAVARRRARLWRHRRRGRHRAPGEDCQGGRRRQGQGQCCKEGLVKKVRAPAGGAVLRIWAKAWLLLRGSRDTYKLAGRPHARLFLFVLDGVELITAFKAIQ